MWIFIKIRFTVTDLLPSRLIIGALWRQARQHPLYVPEPLAVQWGSVIFFSFEKHNQQPQTHVGLDSGVF